MSVKQRVYSVLVVSAAKSLNGALDALLQGSKYDPVCTVSSIRAAKRELAERAFDFVVINAPLPDACGTRFAIDAGTKAGAVVLLLVRSGAYADTYEKVAKHGVFILEKPTSKSLITQALEWMASTKERLRIAEKERLSVEKTMEEIRLVNRAKWLLINEHNMDEPEAHRYIEKQAMDRCVSKREVAEEIIQAYR